MKKSKGFDELKSMLMEKTDSELLEVVFDRFDNAEFCGMKINPKSGYGQYIVRRWKGNTHVICGLCADLSLSAMSSYFDNETPAEEVDGNDKQ